MRPKRPLTILALLLSAATALPAPARPEDAVSDHSLHIDENTLSACSSASVRLVSALKGVTVMRAATGIRFVPCAGGSDCVHMVQCASPNPSKFECLRLRRCTYNPLFPLRMCVSITPCGAASYPSAAPSPAQPLADMQDDGPAVPLASAVPDATANTHPTSPASPTTPPPEVGVAGTASDEPCTEEAVHLRRANEGVVLRRTKGPGISYRSCGNHTHCFHRLACVGELTMDDGTVVKRECFVEHPCRDHSAKMPRCHLEVPCRQHTALDGDAILFPENVPRPLDATPENSESFTGKSMQPCGDAGVKLRRAAKGFTLRRTYGPGIMYQPCSLGGDGCLMTVECDGSQTHSSPLEDGGLLSDAAGWPRCLEKEDCTSTPTSLECMREVACGANDDDDADRTQGTHPSMPQPAPPAEDLPLVVQTSHVNESDQGLPMQCDVGAVQLSRAASGFWFAPARGGLRLVPCRTGENSLCVQMLPCQSDDDNLTCLQRVPCDGSGTEICLTTTPCPM